MKKVAVLYYGIHNNYCFKECFYNFKKMIIKPNSDKYDFDIFMHQYTNKEGWYPYKNSDKINKNSLDIDYNFIKKIVKPKMYKEEPIIDFTDSKYNKILGDNLIYKYDMMFDTKKKIYIVYNFISKNYSVYKVNMLRKYYENKHNIKYDLVMVLNTNLYFFEKLIIDNYNYNILSVLGYWDFKKKFPTVFKHKSSGHYKPEGIYDTFYLSNSKIIDIYCSIFFYLKFYYSLPIQTCKYKKFNYHQAAYLVWKHLTLNKISFKKINIISGIYRLDGVKINEAMCPDDKLNLVNTYDRTDGFKLSKDARDYIKVNE